MRLEQLIDQFDLVADAKEGITQLRKVILDLAFQGELTARRITDEPSEKLVARIKEEKEQLYKNGGIRKPKFNQPDYQYINFDLPKNWEAVPFGNISTIWNGRQYKRSEHKDSGTPIIRIQNLTGSTNNWIYSDMALKDEKYCKKGDLLYSWSGTFTPHIWQGERAIFHYHIWKIDLYDNIAQKYIYYLLEAISESLRDSSHGIMLPHMTKGGMQEWTIPLSPYQEQQRIVQKIEMLFARVNVLEQKMEQDREVDERLQVAVLNDLQRAQIPEASRQSWQRLTDHFEQIYRKPEHIDQLKQAILNEAVRGRLVPQDPNDEPAEQLLERITEEKQRLYNEGEIRKPKDLPEVTEEEIPYALPAGWCWCRINDLFEVVRGGSPRPAGDPKYYNGDIPFLKVADLTNDDEMYVQGFSNTIKEAGLRKTRKVETDVVLLTNSGATLGVPKITSFPTTFNDGIAAFLPYGEGVLQEYLYLFLFSKTNWFRDFASRGQGQPNLNTTIIREVLFALPPTNHQRLILEKAKKINSWCDDLQTTLHRARQTDRRLLEALVS